MRISSLSWVLPLVLALTLHHVLASSDADAHTSAQEGDDAAPARSKRGLHMLRLGRGLQMLRLGKRGSEFEGSEFDYSPTLDPLLFQMLMEDSEPTDDSLEYSNGYDGYYTPGGNLITRYRRSLDDMPYSDEDMDDEAFEGEEEKRGLGMLRLGKRQLGMLRLGKRQLGMLRLGKRPMGMLRLGKRPMGMLRLGKRPMGMLRLGKRPMGMLRLGKRPMGMLRLGKRPMGMLRLGKKDDESLKEEDKRQMGMLRLGKKDDEDPKEEDKRQLGMLRLGKRDVSVASGASQSGMYDRSQ